MLLKEAIEKVAQVSPGFSATFFLVANKDGEMRPLLNLKHLNRFIHTHIFKMHTPQSILQMVRKGSWLASIYLEDAYFHVPIHPDFRIYMRSLSSVRLISSRGSPLGCQRLPGWAPGC